MGSWGTGISSDDSFQDIYDEFFQHYNNEIPLFSIRERLQNSYSDLIQDPDESNVFYFALAKAQWICGKLDNDIHSKVKEIVESGSEMDRWRRLGASESDLRKRANALRAFLVQLSKNNPKPRKPKKVKHCNSVFNTGDCLSIDLGNGFYGAGLVLYHETNTEFGLNLILLIDYYSQELPKSRDIEKGLCLMYKPPNLPVRPFAMYCYATMFKKVIHRPLKFDSIKVTAKFSPHQNLSSYGRWDSLAEQILHSKTEGNSISGVIKASKIFKKSLFSWPVKTSLF